MLVPEVCVERIPRGGKLVSWRVKRKKTKRKKTCSYLMFVEIRLREGKLVSWREDVGGSRHRG